jgi:hypothetical protein
MDFSTVVGIFLLLWGGCLILGGMRAAESVRAERLFAGDNSANRRERAHTSGLLAAFGMMGVGLACFGVTVLPNASGYFIAIPLAGPLLDRLISIASIVLPVAGFFAVFLALFLERPRGR